MRRAQAMAQLDESPLRQEYWTGYQRGLRRAYHGTKFGTQAEHKLWMSLIDDPDESREQRGLGYRDGWAAGKISSVKGAPNKVGENPVMLDPLRVSGELEDALIKKAKSLGISVPDARRKAYQIFIDNCQQK